MKPAMKTMYYLEKTINRLRRGISLVIAGSLCLSFCGCGMNPDETGEESEPQVGYSIEKGKKSPEKVKSTGYIKVPNTLDYVMMYAEPNEDSQVLENLYNGDEIEVFDLFDQWYYAGTGSSVGYIKAKHVSLTPPSEDVNTRVYTTTSTTTTVTTTTTTTETTTTTTEPVTTAPPETDSPEETTVPDEPAVTDPAASVPGLDAISTVPPVVARELPVINSPYIFDNAQPSAEVALYTLHADGNFDYWIADFEIHSPDPDKCSTFTARGYKGDTGIASGACYDYIIVTLVPYYWDGTSGATTTVRYDVIVG